MRHTEETKAKLSAMRRGSLNPFFGKKHSDEFKKSLSARTTAFNAKRQYAPMAETITIPEDKAIVAYLAGLVDADGSMGFHKGRPFVAIYNTHRPLIDWIMATLNAGGVTKGKMGREQVLAWRVDASLNVHALITAIRPFLIVKATDADVALRWIEEKPWASSLL